MNNLTENWNTTGNNTDFKVTNLPSGTHTLLNVHQFGGTAKLQFDGTSNFNANMRFDIWSIPVRIDIIENEDSIEFIYKQTSNSSLNNHSQRVFKIIYSCVDGKWNKSEPIYGEIIPSQKESYKF